MRFMNLVLLGLMLAGLTLDLAGCSDNKGRKDGWNDDTVNQMKSQCVSSLNSSINGTSSPASPTPVPSIPSLPPTSASGSVSPDFPAKFCGCVVDKLTSTFSFSEASNASSTSPDVMTKIMQDCLAANGVDPSQLQNGPAPSSAPSPAIGYGYGYGYY